MNRFKAIAIPAAVVMGVFSLISWAARDPLLDAPDNLTKIQPVDTIRPGSHAADGYMAGRWKQQGLTPAERADDLSVLRRLSLVLHGTVPSLEEVRLWEADTGPDRLDRWIQVMLNDVRFGDYFAERLARSLVGTEDGPFILFRRDQFTQWLGDQLVADRPYNEIAREIIASTGLWTGEPATNFITMAIVDEELDENKLAGRSVRAFLGQRMDCAQCHDHPFDDWKQHEFEGLAAFFGQTKASIVGIEDTHSELFRLSDLKGGFSWLYNLKGKSIPDQDGASKELWREFQEQGHALKPVVEVSTMKEGTLWLISDSDTKPEAKDAEEEPAEDATPPENDPSGMNPRFVILRADDLLVVYDVAKEFLIDDQFAGVKRVAMPSVPFHPEWLLAESEGTRRERFAHWITHEENRRFERAIANRVWGLMFGRPWYDPVDDLPDPDPETTDLLDILGADFRAHNYSVKHLIRIIAATRAFQLSSEHPTGDVDEFRALSDEWGVFPLVRLRPEQVIGSMLQASYVRTIDQNSHLFVRAYRFFNEQNFVNEYGDLGDDELVEQSGTIPQALLRMNGQFTRESIKTSPFSAAGRILALSGDNEQLVENCFLVCLSRRPTEDEKSYFLKQLEEAPENQRNEIVQDLYWSLFNAPEFSWAH